MKPIFFILILALTACVHKENPQAPITPVVPQPIVVATPVATPTPEASPAAGVPQPVAVEAAPKTLSPIVGWAATYDAVIKGAVTDRMLNVPAARMKPFCPNWGTFNAEQKKAFYAHLIAGIAKYESDYYSNQMYWETDLEKDIITKQDKISEGLLQLSYSDEQTYKCGFDYAKDKVAFLDDMKRKQQTWYSNHPERTILQPELNLKCGVKIINYRLGLTNDVNKNQDFLTLLRGRKTLTGWKGGYWSALRKKETQIKDIMVSKGTKCW